MLNVLRYVLLNVIWFFPPWILPRSIPSVIRILLMELPHLYDFGRVEEIVSLLKLVLKTNVVNFKGRLFLQIKGGAMGTPVLVCVAILYMFFQQRS